MKKIVYICGAYAADTPEEIEVNIKEASRVALIYVLSGYTVFCPHTNFGFMRDYEKTHRETIMDMCIKILAMCDILVALPSWKTSAGSQREIREAEEFGLEIIYYEEKGDGGK